MTNILWAVRCDPRIVAALPSSKSKRRGTRGAESLPCGSPALAPAKSFTSFFEQSPREIGGFQSYRSVPKQSPAALGPRPSARGPSRYAPVASSVRRRRRGDVKEGTRPGCADKSDRSTSQFHRPSGSAPFPLCILSIFFSFYFLFLLNKSIEQLSARHSQSFCICQSNGVAADRSHTHVHKSIHTWPHRPRYKCLAKKTTTQRI